VKCYCLDVTQLQSCVADRGASPTKSGDLRQLREAFTEPKGGSVKQIVTHGVASIEHIAQVVFAQVDAGQRQLDSGDHVEASLRGVGDRRKTVDRTDIEWQVGSAHAGEFGGEHQKIGLIDQRRKTPREEERESQVVGGDHAGVCERVHLVLEREHHSRVDLQRQMKIEWSAARVLGMQIDLKGLPHRVGLDEVALIVDVKSVVGRVIFEIGNETRDIDDGQG